MMIKILPLPFNPANMKGCPVCKARTSLSVLRETYLMVDLFSIVCTHCNISGIKYRNTKEQFKLAEVFCVALKNWNESIWMVENGNWDLLDINNWGP